MRHGTKSVGVEGKEKRDEKEDDKVYERQKHEKEEMEKIKKIKQEAWKYINKYRRSREGIDEDMRKRRRVEKSLYGNFRRNRAQRGQKTGGGGYRAEEKIMEEREVNIEKEEVIYQLRNLKEKKAMWEDG